MALTYHQHERLDALESIINRKAIEPERCCWLVDEWGNDSDESYCYACAKMITTTPVFADYGQDVSRAGYAFEYDSPQWCEHCGVILDYTLTDYGVDMELDHFTEYPLDDLGSPSECFELARVAWGLDTDEQKLRFLRLFHRKRLSNLTS